MKRLFFSCLVAIIAVAGSVDRVAKAQSAEFLKHFQIVPRLSTLRVTGGIAGIDTRYRLSGEYDLQHGIGWDAYARFVNAEVWGSIISDGPVIAVVLDVDELLNLERLKGEALPVRAPFDVFKFTGQTADGSDLTLFAALLGPWMYVSGESTPPPDSADFFNYQLRMLAHTRPFADFNGDGIVDAADYTALRDSQGSAAANAAFDGAGYAEWQSQFGLQPPDLDALDAMMGAALGSSALATAVPEPSAAILVLLGLMLCAGVRLLR